MACCSRVPVTSIDGKLKKQILSKLTEIGNLIPGSNGFLIVSTSGVVILSSTDEFNNDQDLLRTFGRMKRASVSIANHFKETICPIIKIKGERYLYSSFEIGDHLLIFYANLTANQNFDNSSDERIINLCEDIRQLLSHKKHIGKSTNEE
eukprot:TRINITY_DN262_c2_g5_i2.p1 TRINITY_DN262_c2_g5~~TRINITY_DN262_c2_g5_i2.p1  ORF type:complete len:150 (+),score=53.67 TRINITY_DN262_c2_g5_i2:71-520(+)